MSVNHVGTQTDAYITCEIGLTQLILLEQLQSKWFRTFPTLSPLSQLRLDLGLATEEDERASYEKEFEPAFGSYDEQFKEAKETFRVVEKVSWKGRQNRLRGVDTPKVVEVVEESDQCSCKIFC